MLNKLFVLLIAFIMVFSSFPSVGASDGTLVSGFEDGWVAGSGAQFFDSRCVEGSGSLRLRAYGGVAITTLVVDRVLSNPLEFWLYAESLSGFSSLTILLSSVPGMSCYLSATVGSSELVPGWNHLTFDLGRFKAVNGESPKNVMLRIRLRLTPRVGESAEVLLDAMRCGVPGYGRVVFAFDDGFNTTYTLAHPVLDKYGFKGDCFVETGYVTNSSRGGMMSLPMLRELYFSGWGVGSHSDSR